jgi:hypothetical protein
MTAYDKRTLASIAFLAALGIPFIQGALKNQPLGDEGYWISAGDKYLSLYASLDLKNPAWTDGHFYDWGWQNPQLGKYIIGMPAYLAGGGHDLEYFYDWGHTMEWNMRNGRVPPAGLLFRSRLPGALCGLLSCALLFLMLRRRSLIAALFAAAYLAFNGFFVETTAMAMNDGPYVLFSIACVGCLMLHSKTPRTATAAAAGLFASLSLSTKYLGGITLIFAAGYFLIHVALAAYDRLRKRTSRSGQPGLMQWSASLLVFAAVVPAVFYPLNPQFHGDPAGMFSLTIQRWALSTRFFQEQDARGALVSFDERVGATYEVLADKASSGKTLPAPPELFLLVAGIWAVTKNRMRKPGAALSTPEVLVLWMATVYVVFCIWIPLRWERFFLLPFAASIPAMSLGVAYLLHKMAPGRMPDILHDGRA